MSTVQWSLYGSVVVFILSINIRKPLAINLHVKYLLKIIIRVHFATNILRGQNLGQNKVAKNR